MHTLLFAGCRCKKRRTLLLLLFSSCYYCNGKITCVTGYYERDGIKIRILVVDVIRDQYIKLIVKVREIVKIQSHLFSNLSFSGERADSDGYFIFKF